MLIWYYKPYAAPEEAYIRIYPVDLDPYASYMDQLTGKRVQGSMAMQLGLTIDWVNGDHFSQMWHLKKES